MHGYGRIARTVPSSTITGSLTPYQHDRRSVRDTMVGLGLDEVMPVPFLAPGDLERAGLPGDAVTVTNRSLLDDSLQGIELVGSAAFGFQGHPEASQGPHDAAPLFDRFIEMMSTRKATA